MQQKCTRELRLGSALFDRAEWPAIADLNTPAGLSAIAENDDEERSGDPEQLEELVEEPEYFVT